MEYAAFVNPLSQNQLAQSSPCIYLSATTTCFSIIHEHLMAAPAPPYTSPSLMGGIPYSHIFKEVIPLRQLASFLNTEPFGSFWSTLCWLSTTEEHTLVDWQL